MAAARRSSTPPGSSSTRSCRRCSPTRPAASIATSPSRDSRTLPIGGGLIAARLVSRPRGDERGLALGVSTATYARAVAALDSVAWRGIMPGLERPCSRRSATLRWTSARLLRHQRQGFGVRHGGFDLPRRRVSDRAPDQSAPRLVLRAYRSRRRSDQRGGVRDAGRSRVGGGRGAARGTPAHRPSRRAPPPPASWLHARRMPRCSCVRGRARRPARQHQRSRPGRRRDHQRRARPPGPARRDDPRDAREKAAIISAAEQLDRPPPRCRARRGAGARRRGRRDSRRWSAATDSLEARAARCRRSNRVRRAARHRARATGAHLFQDAYRGSLFRRGLSHRHRRQYRRGAALRGCEERALAGAHGLDRRRAADPDRRCSRLQPGGHGRDGLRGS